MAKKILGSFGKEAVATRGIGKSPEIVRQMVTGLGGAGTLQVEGPRSGSDSGDKCLV